jgi:HK97 family phage major capsid protein
MEMLEIHNMAQKELRDMQISTLNPDKKGSFCIPQSYCAAENYRIFPAAGRRSLESQEYLIPHTQQYIINPVTEKSVFLLAGATYISAGISDIHIPSFSGILVQNLEDGEDPLTDGDAITIGGAILKPKRVYALIDIPRSLLVQSNPDIEKWLEDNITAALALKIDAMIGGVEADDLVKPQGMGYAASIKDVIQPVYDDIVELETSIGSNFGGINLPTTSPAFITNSGGRRILRKKYIGNSGTDPVFKDGKILDYPAFVSDAISNKAGSQQNGNLLLFGNWKDLCIVQFGGYEIFVDPYILKKSGKVQLCVNAYYDFKGLRGAQKVDLLEQPNAYANSFNSIAIK